MESQQEYLRVGDLARISGRTVRTIHYYEELGLLKPQEHTRGGFRLFASGDVEKLRTITRLQESGLPLDEIGDIVRTWQRNRTGSSASRKLREVLSGDLAFVQKKMCALRLLEREIRQSIDFIGECVDCEKRPEEERCGLCSATRRKSGAPPLVKTFME